MHHCQPFFFHHIFCLSPQTEQLSEHVTLSSDQQFYLSPQSSCQDMSHHHLTNNFTSHHRQSSCQDMSHHHLTNNFTSHHTEQLSGHVTSSSDQQFYLSPQTEQLSGHVTSSSDWPTILPVTTDRAVVKTCHTII